MEILSWTNHHTYFIYQHYLIISLRDYFIISLDDESTLQIISLETIASQQIQVVYLLTDSTGIHFQRQELLHSYTYFLISRVVYLH